MLGVARPVPAVLPMNRAQVRVGGLSQPAGDRKKCDSKIDGKKRQNDDRNRVDNGGVGAEQENEESGPG
jgi:hypothetical protein